MEGNLPLFPENNVEDELQNLKVFVCRLSPRKTHKNKPRGTLIDHTVDIQNINTSISYVEYYQRTIANQRIPDPLVIEFGQPPTKNGKLLVEEGDLLILLVGSDDPDGSMNERGIIGLAIVEDTHLTGAKTSARCALKAKPILKLKKYLDKSLIRQSAYYAESMISDIKIFGVDGFPQAHNFVRFYEEGESHEIVQQRLRGLLGMMKEADPDIKNKLDLDYPQLARFIPDYPTTITAAANTLYIPDKVSLSLTVALCTKPFAILTGSSGTGKSSSAIELASAFDYGANLPNSLINSRVQPATCLAFVSVGADWTDQTNLLGYRNPFGSKHQVDGIETNLTYEVTDALKLILRASHPDYRKFPHFLILDEMNLSHVERYFSSFLSLMEADQSATSPNGFDLINRDDLRIITNVLREQGNSPMEVEAAESMLRKGFGGLSLPSNLFVIGTVNIDETTYMFSPKVLDRAFVIELKSVEPNEYLNKTEHDKGEVIDRDVADELFTRSINRRVNRAWNRKHSYEILDDVTQGTKLNLEQVDEIKQGIAKTLSGTYKLLDSVGFGFGYRITDEVFRYVAIWIETQVFKQKKGESLNINWQEYALDQAILMKVLPKLHGNRRQLGDSLKALAAFFDQKASPEASYQLGDAPRVEIISNETTNEKLSFSLLASKSKVERLHRVLQASGYTTFIS